MKVPTRRWGNLEFAKTDQYRLLCLNESPHPKVGKYHVNLHSGAVMAASMKVPTRRWGNLEFAKTDQYRLLCLNESPHPKVGK